MSDERILLILNIIKKIAVVTVLIGTAIINWDNIDNIQIGDKH